ncbi:hypothetical protein C1890_31930 [Pseudomonas sp. DP16D-R1]|nr:hypothetical protein C1890_31930 [Pseudomonas sp. DP16D-R1]
MYVVAALSQKKLASSVGAHFLQMVNGIINFILNLIWLPKLLKQKIMWVDYNNFRTLLHLPLIIFYFAIRLILTM